MNENFIQILIEENVVSKILLLLTIEDIHNFCLAYPIFDEDKIFTKYVVPNMLATRLNNESLYNALVLCLKFLIEEALIMNVNLKREIVKLERIIKNTKQNEQVLACFMAWDYTKQKKIMTLSKMCKIFGVSQEDLYAFANSYVLEI